MYAARESAWHEIGTWKELSTPTGKAAMFTCPLCGQTGTLEPGDFKFESDGTVEPSVKCFNDGCSFHDRVILTGWNPLRYHDYRSSPHKVN